MSFDSKDDPDDLILSDEDSESEDNSDKEIYEKDSDHIGGITL